MAGSIRRYAVDAAGHSCTQWHVKHSTIPYRRLAGGSNRVINRVKAYIPRIILLDALLAALLLMAVRLVLHLFGLTFRKWFFIVCLLIFAAAIIAGIIQLFLKIRKRSARILAVTIYIVLTAAVILFTYPITLFAIAGEEHVVEREEGKFVAYVNGFLHTYVYYYEYKNFLICGETKRIEEDYGKGGFDPVDNPYGFEYSPVSTTYYDKEGSAVSFYLDP